MQTTLVHNPEAGRGEYGAGQLIDLLERAGHDVRYQSSEDDDWEKVLDQSADLVMVAGGDGTVHKVAFHLLGRGLPLSVLPLGTANNLARTLGFLGSVEELLAGLSEAEPQGFDVGCAHGPWGERYFFEGVGGGLLPDYLSGMAAAVNATEKKQSLSKEEEMARHVSLLQQLLTDYHSQEWRIRIDGQDFSGRYLLWEAMNIRSVGPVLTLAADARTNDGRLDFVAAKETDRAALLDYLEARLGGKEATFPIAARRFRRLEFHWEKTPIHLDDKIWPEKGEPRPAPTEIVIEVQPGALQVWLAKSKQASSSA